MMEDKLLKYQLTSAYNFKKKIIKVSYRKIPKISPSLYKPLQI